MGEILYDPTSMNALYDDLQHSGSTLQTEAENLKGYAGQFHNALQGDNANQSFDAVFSKWGNDYDDNLQVLNQLQQSVEDALHRALAADSAVGQGFEVF
ncbi:WXG100 family type VII secretion target [Nocardia alni]|uniref:WXG100 family type VII secretion target n=1 Tax=Nocardia alni TaxID=2815723 RepID=UPI001C2482FF|nr:type VII secretion protein EsxR [Nocardia alni]